MSDKKEVGSVNAEGYVERRPWYIIEGWEKGKRIFAQNRAEVVDKKLIVRNTLAEFVEDVEKAILEGYELTLHKNEGYPTHMPPSVYSCVLTLFRYPPKKEPKEIAPEKAAMLEKFAEQAGAAVAEVEAKEPSRRGRKPKGVVENT